MFYLLHYRYLNDGESTAVLVVVPLLDGIAGTFLVEKADISLEKMCAFASDVAAAMVGNQNGVPT